MHDLKWHKDSVSLEDEAFIAYVTIIFSEYSVHHHI
jgi:hypothetical protein